MHDSQDLQQSQSGKYEVDVDMAKKVGGEGFQDMDLGEIQQLRDTKPDDLKGDLTEMSASEPVPDNEEEDVEAMPENRLTLDNLAEGFDFFYGMDPSMISTENYSQGYKEDWYCIETFSEK